MFGVFRINGGYDVRAFTSRPGGILKRTRQREGERKRERSREIVPLVLLEARQLATSRSLRCWRDVFFLSLVSRSTVRSFSLKHPVHAPHLRAAYVHLVQCPS